MPNNTHLVTFSNTRIERKPPAAWVAGDFPYRLYYHNKQGSSYWGKMLSLQHTDHIERRLQEECSALCWHAMQPDCGYLGRPAQLAPFPVTVEVPGTAEPCSPQGIQSLLAPTKEPEASKGVL